MLIKKDCPGEIHDMVVWLRKHFASGQNMLFNRDRDIDCDLLPTLYFFN